MKKEDYPNPKKRINIAFCIYSLGAGGAEKVMTTMANFWAEKNISVTIVTQATSASHYNLHKNVAHHSLRSAKSSSNIISTLFRNFVTVFRLRILLKRIDADLVISFMTTMNVISVIAGRTLGLPVIISERYNPWKFTPPLTWKIFRRSIYPFAKYIVVQSNESKQFFDSFCNPTKVITIYNPVILPEKFSSQSYQKKRNIILAIGRLKYVKGFDLLLQAFAALQAPDWELNIIGEGEERKNLEKLRDTLNLNGKVNLPGQFENVKEHYCSASIFVLCSRAEGFPNSLAEAMSFGLACVSTDCETGPAIMINSGTDGLLVPNKDINSLGVALQSLIDQPALREKLGTAARNSITKFEINKVMQQWEKLLN